MGVMCFPAICILCNVFKRIYKQLKILSKIYITILIPDACQYKFCILNTISLYHSLTLSDHSNIVTVFIKHVLFTWKLCI